MEIERRHGRDLNEIGNLQSYSNMYSHRNFQSYFSSTLPVLPSRFGRCPVGVPITGGVLLPVGVGGAIGGGGIDGGGGPAGKLR